MKWHKAFIIFLTFEFRIFLAQYILNITNDFKLEKYYKCLKKIAFQIHNIRQKEAIVCNLGETCILKSNSCQKPYIFFTNLKYKWMTRESELISLKEINFDPKNNFYVDPQTNNLIIKSVAMEATLFRGSCKNYD